MGGGFRIEIGLRRFAEREARKPPTVASSSPLVTVMQSADLRDGNHATTPRLSLPRDGRVALQREMGPDAVVVGDVCHQNPPQVPLAEHDQVVEALPTNRADGALREMVLPGRLPAGDDLANPHPLHPPSEPVTIDRVPVTDEESWDWPIAWECLDELLGRPFRGRAGSDIEVEDAPAIVGEDQEAHQKPERGCGNDEEVAGRRVRQVISEEDEPGLRAWPASALGHVLLHRRLGDIVAEQGHLGLNALGAPEEILASHPSDQMNDLAADPRTASPSGPRFQAPEDLESLAVSSDYGLGLHEHEAGSPVLPDPRDEDPEDAIGPLKLWPFAAPLKDQELVTEGQVLEGELGTALWKGPQEDEKSAEEEHRWLPEGGLPRLAA